MPLGDDIPQGFAHFANSLIRIQILHICIRRRMCEYVDGRGGRRGVEKLAEDMKEEEGEEGKRRRDWSNGNQEGEGWRK